MTNKTISKKTETGSEEGFPVQAKLLLAVIAVSLAMVILKALGVF